MGYLFTIFYNMKRLIRFQKTKTKIGFCVVVGQIYNQGKKKKGVGCGGIYLLFICYVTLIIIVVFTFFLSFFHSVICFFFFQINHIRI